MSHERFSQLQLITKAEEQEVTRVCTQFFTSDGEEVVFKPNFLPHLMNLWYQRKDSQGERNSFNKLKKGRLIPSVQQKVVGDMAFRGEVEVEKLLFHVFSTWLAGGTDAGELTQAVVSATESGFLESGVDKLASALYKQSKSTFETRGLVISGLKVVAQAGGENKARTYITVEGERGTFVFTIPSQVIVTGYTSPGSAALTINL